MTDMPKFRVGDVVGSRINPAYEYEVVAVLGPGTVNVKVLSDGLARGYVHRAVDTEPLHLLRPASPQPGGTIYAIADFADIRGVKRLTKGKGYEVKSFSGSTVQIKACDAGHTCYWVDWTENFSLTPPAPDAQDGLTILDAEGRAALKVGDRVLVEVIIVGALDGDGDLEIAFDSGDEYYVKPESVYAKLPAAETKKEIAVGDFVSILRRTGSKGKVLAFMSNGHAVVEYAAGDDFNVSHYDVSCLEVI